MKTDISTESSSSAVAGHLPADEASFAADADPLAVDAAQHDRAALGRAPSHMSSLRSKLVLSLAAVFVVFLLVDELVRRSVIQPEFLALEKAGAVRDTRRVLAAIETEVDYLRLQAEHLAVRLNDWQRWSGGFPESTRFPTEQRGGRVDFAVMLNRSGEWNEIDFMVPRLGHQSSQLPEKAFDDLIAHSRAVAESHLSGLTQMGDHSLWIFALVRLSDGQAGPSPVTLQDRPDVPGELVLLARQVDASLLNRIREQTQVDFALDALAAVAGRPSEVSVGSFQGAPANWQTDTNTLVAKAKIRGISGKQLASLFVKVPREVTGRSQRTIALARNSFIFGSVVAILMLLFLLQRIVIGPLKAIRRHSDDIARKGMATESLVLGSNDEIGQLAKAFDKMMNRLSETQTQLSRASQAAGRSQVASAVIHNVGNVLTNVNSLIDAAGHRTSSLRIQPLNKLASRLREASDNDGLLAATPEYLENLAGSLATDQQSINELLKTLDDNVQHIHGIIQAQREHTGHDLKPSRFRLKEVIDEAIACCRARLLQDSVEVSVQGSLSGQLRTDRSLLLQTMINLITNARHAMRDQPMHNRRLSIEASAVGQHMQIQIQDSGCGMSSETLRQVFNAHFTTRENGTGLGLHFCAITLKRLGGSIAATSRGVGDGATFTIFLPRTINTMEEVSTEVTESK